MTGGSNPRVLASVRALAEACCAGAVLIGSLVLVGWALDVTILKSVLPGRVAMKANAALAFVLAGVSLWLLRTQGVSGGRRWVAHACAAVVAVLGLLTLGEHVLGWNLGIDQLLFREGPGAAGTSAPGRTAPNAAFGFLLIGLALLLLDVETRGGARPAQALAAATALVSLLGLLGYAYGVPELYGIGPYTQMALHSAVLFLVLGVGVLLARPDRGWMRAVMGDGVGGVMARRLLPAVIVVPPVLGWVRLLGERAGLYDTEIGLSLFAISNIVVFSVLVVWSASRLEAVDVERRKIEARFRGLLEAAPDAIVVVNQDGRIEMINTQAEQLFGYGREELAGRPIEVLIPERLRSVHERHRVGFVARPEPRRMGSGLCLDGRRKDASTFPAEVSLSPVETKEGLLVMAAVRDVTERARTQAELTARARQQAAVAELGQRALSGVELPALMDEAVAAVARTLDVELSKVLELLPEGGAFLLRAGVGWKEGLVGRATVEAGEASQAGFTLLSREPVVVADLRAETRFRGSALLYDHGVVSGLTVVVVPGRDRPFGVLGAHTARARGFSSSEIHFLQGVANVLAGAIERKRSEDALRKSEARLSAAQRMAHVGSWDLDVRTNEVWWSDEVYRIFGLSAAEFSPTYDAVLRFIPRGDRERVEAAVREALEGKNALSLDHRIVRPDGTERVIHGEGAVSFGEGGEPERMVGTLQDITERRRLEEIRRRSEEIEEQNLRIQEASRLKSEFLANMSHELRTPLNSIIGFAELMHDGKVGPVSPEHKEYLGDILTSGRHLHQLINDVLDLAKVESGKMEFAPEPVDLSRLVGEVRDILRTLSAETRVQVETEVDPALIAVVADPRRLKQVLYNYLSNALKFTPERGRATVRVAPEGPEWFRMEVADTGVGIRPEDLGRLFVEFQQLDPGMSKRHAGTGLGLALTRRIVEAQGGHVGVRSSPGEGSVFFAVLPRVPRAAAGPEPRPPRAPFAAVRTGAPLVLIVEDDAKDQAWLVETLTGAGYGVEAVATGSAAIGRCRERSFDAIVLDLLLPDMSGWDALRAVRADGPNRDTPTIVVTVVAEAGAGAVFSVQDILHKPLRDDELLDALRRAGVVPGEARPILVVDDDPKDLKLMEATLRQFGYRPVCRADGESGLEAALSEPPAAVVLDLLMPGVDGFEFLARFRRTSLGRRTPVIVWTAHGLTAETLARLKATAQAVVAKGRGAAALLEELQAYVPAPIPPPREPGPEEGARGR